VSLRVGVCDYGVGNLRSVERALLRAGAAVTISDKASDLFECDGVVLPGVGAFAGAAAALHRSGLGEAVRSVAAAGRPVLGVCLGYQMLFERSEEGEGGAGLGLLPGVVTRLRGDDLKVPHMGWNSVRLLRDTVLLDGVESGSYVYFVHSYAGPASGPDVVAVTDYGEEVAAAVQCDNVMGTQFHPEKSGPVGLRVYENFVSACAA